MIRVRSRFVAGPRHRRADLRLGAAVHRVVRLGAAAAACLLLTATALAQSGSFDWASVSQFGPYAGIKRANVTTTTPRNININCLQIDTLTPGLRFFTTAQSGTLETMTQTTRQFITTSQTTATPLAVAINASPWAPFVPAEWNVSRAANLQGLAVSNGGLVSPGDGSAALMVGPTGVASMGNPGAGTSISGIEMAASGFAFVLTNGVPSTGDTTIHPRTGIGLSQDSRYVYLMTMDGRQTASLGATTDEVGSYLQYFGSYTGINMDGGGSTTMAWWNPTTSTSQLLNVPVGQGSFGSTNTERHNGNNLGIYYTAVPEPGAAVLAALGIAAAVLRGRWSRTGRARCGSRADS